jgi:hypothetical protein
MRYGLRSIDPVAFSEGARREIAIPRAGILRELIHELEYDYYVTGGSGAGAIANRPAFRMVGNVQVQIEGAGADATLHNVRGHTLGVIDKLFMAQATPQWGPTDDAATTDENDRKSTVRIPFFVPFSKTPDECALPAAVAKPTLIIDNGSGSELVTSDGDFTTIDITNAVPKLFARRIYGVPEQPYSKWAAMSLRKTEFEVAASGSKNLELSHLRPGMDLVRIIIEAFAGGSSGAQYAENDSLVTALELEINGVKEFEEVPWATLQRINATNYQLSWMETGVAVIDFAEDQLTHRGQVITLTGNQAPVLSLDYTKQTGDCKVVVTTMAIRRGILPR